MAMDENGQMNAHGMTPGRHRMHMLLLGTALAAGAVMLAPYILPAVGIGSADVAGGIMEAVHGLSGGLAGGVNAAIGALPLVGQTLAQGGIWTAAASGVTGIGGMLLSRYVAKREDGTHRVRWSNVIRTAALVTSSLIALPAALTGLTIGITYLSATLFGVGAASSVLNSLAATLPGVGGMSGGVGGLTGLLPHLLTCGATILPASIGWFMNGRKHIPADHGAPGTAMHDHASMRMATRPTGDMHASISIDRPTRAGIPCEATLRLSHQDGSPMTADELAVTHTRKLHLFVIDQALKDYRHIHPQPTGEPGVFRFQFTPATSNRYGVWLDATTLKDGKEHIAKLDLEAAMRRNVTPSIRVNTLSEQGGLQFAWNMQEPLHQDEPAIVDITVKDRQGRPVADLEPVMGAYAHLVGFTADGSRMMHVHPMGAMPAGENDRGGPRLRFHIEPEQAGPVQFFLQVQRGGETMYAPFGQQVMASQSQRAASRHEHGSTAMAY